jgi:heme exporter protein B
MNGFIQQIQRDLKIAWASRLDIGVILLFFVIIVTMFPLAIGPQPDILRPLAVPLLWIAAFLSILAGFDRLFAADLRDGWLDQVALSTLPLFAYVIAKAVAHWLVSALPLLLAIPIVGLLLQVEIAVLPSLVIALLIGTAALTLLGVIGASLASGARQAGGLMALLVLPLALPVLIFGVLASQPEAGMLLSPHLKLLAAVLLVLLAIAPPVAAAALGEADDDGGA